MEGGLGSCNAGQRRGQFRAGGRIQIACGAQFFAGDIGVVDQAVVARPEVELVLRPRRFRNIDRRMAFRFAAGMGQIKTDAGGSAVIVGNEKDGLAVCGFVGVADFLDLLRRGLPAAEAGAGIGIVGKRYADAPQEIGIDGHDADDPADDQSGDGISARPFLFPRHFQPVDRGQDGEAEGSGGGPIWLPCFFESQGKVEDEKRQREGEEKPRLEMRAGLFPGPARGATSIPAKMSGE